MTKWGCSDPLSRSLHRLSLLFVRPVARLNRILALRDLGFSLEQIAQLLSEDLPAAQLHGMLRLRRRSFPSTFRTRWINWREWKHG